MNELTPYVVKDTGVKLLVKKVSPPLVMALNRQYPEPKPPMQEVDLGGETKQEPNYAHPDYLQAIYAYRRDQDERLRHLFFKFGIVIPEDNKTWRDEIAQKRAEFLQEFGFELPHLDGDGNERDELDWVNYCALGTDEDFQELYDAILHRTQPTAEAIEEAKAGFPG